MRYAIIRLRHLIFAEVLQASRSRIRQHQSAAAPTSHSQPPPENARAHRRSSDAREKEGLLFALGITATIHALQNLPGALAML